MEQLIFYIRNKLCFRLIIALFVTGISLSESIAQITYDVTVRNFACDVVNSYPQQICKIERADTATRFVVHIANAYDDKNKRKIAEQDALDISYRYSPDVKCYLQSTRLINCNNPVIGFIADTLFNNKQKTLQVIEAGLKFVSKYITFDDSLAIEISKGNNRTLSIEEVVKRRKGTCSEYTNVFVALMRKLGIPTRFVAGFICMPDRNFYGCHAWAECYIKHYGWFAVDPQSGKLWFPPTAIKLFAGKDFADCDLNSFMDLVPLSINIINK